jgi:hypothetical protein
MVLEMLNTRQYNLLAALQQVDNITKLTEDNDWKEYIYNHLTPIKFELERQFQQERDNEKKT